MIRKYIVVLTIQLIVFISTAQDPQKFFILDDPITQTKSYVARDFIELNAGFLFSATSSRTFSASIDESLIFGVDYDYSDGLPTQTRTLDQSLEVGTTRGSFSVSNSGQAQYTVPISVPKGVAGLQPQLAIHYNQGGSGILGYGFNLTGVSSITRTYPTKYNDGFYGTKRNCFALNGQRLIEVTINSSTYYQTEYDSKTILEYNDAQDYFKQYISNGTIIEYGNGTDSKLSGSDSTSSWYITSITDFHRNKLKYSYQQEYDTTEVLLESIKYFLSGSSEHYAEIVFYYDKEKTEQSSRGIDGHLFSIEHLLRKILVYDQGNLFREYEFSYTKFKPSSNEDAEQVYSYLYQIEEFDDQGNTFNPLIFEWIEQPGDQLYEEAFLTDVIPLNEYYTNYWQANYFAGDIDGDGDMELISDRLNGSTNLHDLILDTYRGDTIVGPSSSYTSMLMGDFNGNGKSEILWHKGTTNPESTTLYEEQALKSGINLLGNEIVLYHSWTGSTFTSTNTITLSELSGKTVDEIFIGDANNDSKSDIFFITSDGWCYIYSCNSTYTFSLLSLGLIGGADKYYLGDFNGDGRSDILKTTRHKASMYSINETDSIKLFMTQDLGDTIVQFNIGDYNGDGKADFAYKGIDTILYSNGAGFSGIDASTSSFDQSADLNGDGKSDLLNIDTNPSSKFTLELPFSSEDEDYFVSDMYDAYYLQTGFQDLSGDGVCDLFVLYIDFATGSQLCSSFRTTQFDVDCDNTEYVALVIAKAVRNPTFQPLLIGSVTDGFNNTTTINYELMTDLDSYSQVTSSSDDFHNSLSPRSIVDYYSVDDGDGGRKEIHYCYEDAMVHRHGKGIMGFSKIVSIDSTLNIKSIREYDQTITSSDATKIVSPHLTTHTLQDISDNAISSQSNTYGVHKYTDNKHCFPYMSSSDFTNSITGQSKKSRYHYTSKSTSGYKYSVLSSSADDYTVSKDSVILDENLTLNLSSDIFLINQTNKDLVKTRSGLSGKKKFTTTYQYPSNSPLLTSITHEPNLSDYKRLKAFKYDSFGNPTRVVDSVPGTAGRYVTYQYDDSKRYTTQVSNALGHTSSTTYQKFGLPQTTTDPNALTSNYSYGNFNRLEIRSTGDSLVWTTSYDWVSTPGSGSAPSNSLYKIESTIPGEYPTSLYFDNLRREIKSVHAGFNGNTVYTDKKYKVKSQVDSVSLPYFSTGSPKWIVSTYDSIGRIIQRTKLGSTTYWSYSGMSVTETANGLPVKRTAGNDGLPVSIQENSGPTVSFTYNVAGLDSIITAPGSIETTIEYDHLGRKTKLTDPDAGIIKYYYNGFGELIAQEMATGDSIAFQYDNLGRLTQKTEIDSDGSNPTRTTNIAYDTINGIGLVKRTSITNEITERYSYDNYSRLSGKSVSIPGQSSPLTEYYTYDKYGRLDSLIYPSGFAIRHIYDVYGDLNYVRRLDNSNEIWTKGEQNELGMITEYYLDEYINQVSYDYDNNYLIDKITSNKYGGYMQKLDYTWDASKKLLTSRKDEKKDITEYFTYDGLNRLKTWQVVGDSNDTIVYKSDNSGRIDSKTGIGTYNYNTSIPQHALNELTNLGTHADTVCHKIEYTAFLKTKTMKHSHDNDSVTFYYGPDNNRYKKIAYNGSQSSTTLYTHGNYEEIQVGEETRKLHYIYSPVGLSAIYVDNSETAIDTMYFILKDHLGSFDQITNDKDYSIEHLSFDPWGNRRNPTDWSFENVPSSYTFERGFTGHEHIGGFGMINMNGRMYDPKLGMFLSPDNFSNPSSVQSMNRYGYAFNNPLSYSDPSGWWPQNDPAENYDEPTGYAPTGGGDVYYVLPNWYNGPADPFAGMGFDFEGKLHDAYINTINTRPKEAGKTFDDYWVLGADGQYYRRDNLASEIASARTYYGQTAFNWLAESGYKNVELHEGYTTSIYGMSMVSDEPGLINIYNENAAILLIDEMRNINQNDLTGNIKDLLVPSNLVFDKVQLSKSAKALYKDVLVGITLLNPDYPPDYGEYYHITWREPDQVGRASYGSIDIAGNHSVLSITIGDYDLFYEIYYYIFGN